MRKLASIQRIIAINEIPNADKIESVVVLGWNCIVKKGEFKVGDLCVYFEPDSLLYPHPIWDDFLEKKKYRIRTMKMKATVSQGLVLGTDIIETLNPKARVKIIEGTDVTDVLNVKHYDPTDKPEVITKSDSKVKNFLMRFSICRKVFHHLYGKKSGGFPTHLVSKTDETNIQSIPYILTNNTGRRFYISEKLEGQNGNYIFSLKKGLLNRLLKRTEFIVCSHHIRKSPTYEKCSWWDIAVQYDIEKKLTEHHKKYGIYLAVQGEIIGDRIQNNIYKISGYDFYVFNVKDLTNNRYFDLEEKREFCEETGLNLVPIIHENFVISSYHTPQLLLDMSNGRSELNKKTKREGFVVRCFDDDRISFKVRSPEYLLGEKE